MKIVFDQLVFGVESKLHISGQVYSMDGTHGYGVSSISVIWMLQWISQHTIM